MKEERNECGNFVTWHSYNIEIQTQSLPSQTSIEKHLLSTHTKWKHQQKLQRKDPMEATIAPVDKLVSPQIQTHS